MQVEIHQSEKLSYIDWYCVLNTNQLTGHSEMTNRRSINSGINSASVSWSASDDYIPLFIAIWKHISVDLLP